MPGWVNGRLDAGGARAGLGYWTRAEARAGLGYWTRAEARAGLG